jgi:hypothetical protein
VGVGKAVLHTQAPVEGDLFLVAKAHRQRVFTKGRCGR